MKNELLAKRLKELRKANNYTQEYVASYLNIGRQAYSHYETGRNTPSSDTLYNIAALYDIPYQSLFDIIMASSHPFSYQMSPVKTSVINEVSDFLEYINTPENEKKLKLLSLKEKELLYYFDKLTIKDQEDILDFIKIKVRKK